MNHLPHPSQMIGALSVAAALSVFSDSTPAACIAGADNLTMTCSGVIRPSSGTDATKSISVYDAAANPSPPWSATHFNPNPPTVTINATNSANFQFINPTTANLFDKGIIGANYPNSENPAVNNWVLNNQGTINLSTNSIANRLQAVISDSQVNQFTLNNSGIINASQNFFTRFDSKLLSNSVAASTGVNTAQYNAAALNPVSAVYTDDNTNALALINNGYISAQGNFAAAIYGRAGDQALVNNGFLGNVNWTPNDALYTGHWAVGNFGGAQFETVAGSNPDTPIYNVYSSGGQNTINVLADSQTTLTNSGTIKGDILMLDSNPLTLAAALASGGSLPVANSGTNSGPRDSIINNSGTISGNLYLGSGEHDITNTGTLNGNINVDQSPSLGSFTVGTPGTQPGTWLSLGPTAISSNTNQPCPATGSNTADASCAQTGNALAYFAGSRIFNLSNLGTLTGDVNVLNTTAGSRIMIGTGITNSGAGTTLNAPDTAAAIQGALNISGAATTDNIALTPVIQPNVIVKNNTWFEVADKFGGNILSAGNLSQLAAGADTGLLSWTAAMNSGGNLVLGASVRDAYTLPGISAAAANSLNSLMGYAGSNAGLLALGNQIQALPTEAAARQGGEQLRPAINNAASQTIFNVSNNLMRILDNHLSEGHMAGFMGADYNPVNHAGQAYRTLGLTPGVWLEGVTFHQDQGTRQGVDGYQGYSNGFAIGADTHFGDDDEWLLGAAFSTSQARLGASGVNSGNTTNISTNQGFIYSSWNPGPVYLNAMAGIGGSQISGYRAVLAQGLNGSGNAMQYSARLDTGIPLQTDYATLIPVAYFAYSRVNQGAYSESGGSAALQVNSTFMNSARTGLGGKAVVPLYEGTVLGSEGVVKGAIEFSALWSHEFANTNTYASASFAAGGGALTFSVPGIGPGRDSGLLGVGTRLNFAETDDIKPSVLLNYFAEIKDQFSSQTGMIQGRIDF